METYLENEVTISPYIDFSAISQAEFYNSFRMVFKMCSIFF